MAQEINCGNNDADAADEAVDKATLCLGILRSQPQHQHGGCTTKHTNKQSQCMHGER
jgi:hypothetical protein